MWEENNNDEVSVSYVKKKPNRYSGLVGQDNLKDIRTTFLRNKLDRTSSNYH